MYIKKSEILEKYSTYTGKTDLEFEKQLKQLNKDNAINIIAQKIWSNMYIEEKKICQESFYKLVKSSQKTTISDAGSLRVGNEFFKLNIPNGYGDGITHYQVCDKKQAKFILQSAIRYYTLIEGTFNVYSYDCDDGRNEIKETISGRFEIYYYLGCILFVKI